MSLMNDSTIRNKLNSRHPEYGVIDRLKAKVHELEQKNKSLTAKVEKLEAQLERVNNAPMQELNFRTMAEHEPVDPDEYVTLNEDKTAISFPVTNCSYRIELNDIQTPMDLLHWVKQIANKPWCCGMTLKLFVIFVERHKGWTGGRR
jgi:hypothetical protein